MEWKRSAELTLITYNIFKNLNVEAALQKRPCPTSTLES
jgi:hypothetical protein